MAKKLYALSEADVKELKAIRKTVRGGKAPLSQKAGPRWQRRASSGGGGNAVGALAIIKGTVPASSAIDVTGTLTESSEVATAGLLAVSKTDDTFTAGALLVELKDNGKLKPRFTGGVLYAIGVLNPSNAPWIGEGNGVAVSGEIETKPDGTEYFVLPTHEVRTRDGYSNANYDNLLIHRKGETGEKIVPSYDYSKNQSIGHNANGLTEWQDDGGCQGEI